MKKNYIIAVRHTLGTPDYMYYLHRYEPGVYESELLMKSKDIVKVKKAMRRYKRQDYIKR